MIPSNGVATMLSAKVPDNIIYRPRVTNPNEIATI